jgi:hypothetical protein
MKSAFSFKDEGDLSHAPHSNFKSDNCLVRTAPGGFFHFMSSCGKTKAIDGNYSEHPEGSSTMKGNVVRLLPRAVLKQDASRRNCQKSITVSRGVQSWTRGKADHRSQNALRAN